MKKQKAKIIVMIIAVITILAITVLAWAKYTSVFDGNTQKQVAKWSFKVNDSEEGAKTFNLVNTIDSNDSVKENEVAPGTSGHFDIKLNGAGSEVAINYIINADFENNPVNMHFYLDENHTVELPIEDGKLVINDFIPLAEIDNEKIIRIYWNWPSETGNTEKEIYENDLLDSESMGKTITANVTVTGIQTKPETSKSNYTAYYYLENANDNNFTLYSSNIYEKNTDSELTLSNIAIDIPNANYIYGTTTPEGEHVSNVKIAEDGTTKVYLYYARERYTLTTIAGENIGEVKSTGLSTGTSSNVTSESGENVFKQSKTKMRTKYKWGETVTIEAVEESVDGYSNKFKNWSITSTETAETTGTSTILTPSDLGAPYNPEKPQTTIIMPKQNVELTAIAEKTVNTYTVIFKENTGTGTMEDQNFVYDVEQKLTSNKFTKTGYTFESWNTSEDGTGTKYTNEQLVKNLVPTPNGTLMLYAQWLPNEYTIIFNANGGHGAMPVQTLKYDETQAIQENTLTREGYIFAGWNLSADGTDTSYANKEQVLNLISENGGRIELYAQWSANSYTVEFNANGGKGTMTNQVFTYDVAKALRANVYTRTGYTFVGWSTDANYVVKSEDATSTTGSGNSTETTEGNSQNTTGAKLYKDKEEVSNLATTPNGTITLYAIWTKNKYTVIYNPNAPTETTTGSMENSKYEYNTTARLSENEYQRTGYTFKNWNTKPDGTGTTYNNGQEIENLTQTANGIVNLYAQWTANIYRINFSSNTGIGTMDTQVCTYDVSTNISANKFKKTGYTFAGWCTVDNPTETTEIYNNSQEIINLVSENNGQITLYAQWTANTNTPYEVAHFVMNTKGIYTLAQTENLAGTTDSNIDINKLIKTSTAYNIPNGIYYKETKVDGKIVTNATIKPDGTLQIAIYYARTYGYLTTAKGSYISTITQINNKKYYYGETIPDITATVEYAQGYLTNFDKWESNNVVAIENVTENPIQNKTWPAMEEGTQITLTAKATREESNQTPYTVNYYLENANNSEYTLYSIKTLAGITNSQITVSDVDIELPNCTIAKTDITTSTIIKADGTTKVNVYYNRNKFALTISGGNNIIETELSTENEQNVDNTAPITKNIKWGATVEINATIESLPGYTYEYTGWETTSTSELGTEYDYTKKHTQIIMPAENLTLTATASKTANKYTIIFDANSGNGTMANQIFTYDVAQKLSKNTFTKTGYTFKGWATEESLNAGSDNQDENKGNTSETGNDLNDNRIVYVDEAQIKNLTTTNNQTITLYAIWADETAPQLTLTTTSTTKTITVNVTAIEQGSGLTENYKYYIGTKNLATNKIEYQSAIEKTATTHTFEELKDNTTYYIKVEIADKSGNIGKIEDQEAQTLELQGEITFTDGYWSNGKYVVTVNTEATDETGALYNMQYQVLTAEEIEDGKTFNAEENWEDETITTGTVMGLGTVDDIDETSATKLILKDGDIIYARVTDGSNGAKTYYNYEVKNPAKKTYTETELAQLGYGTSTFDILAYEIGADKIKVDIQKEISGTETYNYYAKANEDSEYKLISTSTNWNDMADVSNKWLKALNKDELKSNTTYKVKVLARDSSGNVTQCLNTATMITQDKAEVNTSYAQNRTYIDGENYTAVIPAGFKISSTSGENVISKGMVLKDADGNEFVWVPVNQAIYIPGKTAIPTSTSSVTTYYKPMAIAQNGSVSSYESIVYSYNGVKSYRNTNSTGIGKSSFREPSLITGSADGYTWNVNKATGTNYDANTEYYQDILGFSTIQEYGNYINKEYANMVNSTNNFGGFYIGRYETSANEINVDTENGNTTTKLQVQSKPGKTPMSNLDWYNLYLNQDSNRNSNNTYYETQSVVSSMIWGSQYDSMLNWVLTGLDKSKLQATTYGNRTNSQALTGSYSNDVINNIYDLIANDYEWTQEVYSTNIRVSRGNSFDKSKSANATIRGYVATPNIAGLAYSSRMALYINDSEDTTSPEIKISSVEPGNNNITVKVSAKDIGSGIAKYHYSISTDNKTWKTETSYSPEHIYTGLAQNSTYYIKVQAEDNKGNMSVTLTQEVVTKGVSLEEGAIYVISVTGSADGNGIVNLGVREDYADNNYKIQYQIVLGQNAIDAGKTADEENGIYTQITEDGAWVTGNVVEGLYENDIIYARLSDGTNITPYMAINVIGLETFSEIYSETQPYSDVNGDIAYIPAGFSVGTSKYINTVENGLVIQDELGNQFVWVPVESALANGTTYPTSTSSTSTYKPMAIYQDNSKEYYQSLIYSFSTSAKTLSYAISGYKLGKYDYREPSLSTGAADGYTWDLESLASISGSTNDGNPTYFKNYLKFSSATEYGKYKNEEYKNMIDSIEYYKGFYVGRYETSANSTASADTVVAQSQSGQKVLDNSSGNTSAYRAIYYQDSNRNPVNPYYNSSSITSSMIWNAQYNAMLNWLLKKSDNKEKVFSTTYGNHKIATAADLSGANVDDLTNNIYDLGGNVREINQGSYAPTRQIMRGGAFYKNSNYPGNYSMASYNAWNLANISTSYNCYGTRMALYLNKQNDTTLPTIEKYGDPISTTNSITLKTRAKDENSGIAKYHYYISTDGTNFTEYTGWGNSYTFEKLTQNTTYYVKATVEDKAGNVSSELPVQTVTTNIIDGIEEILTTRVYGSDGDGRLYLGMSSTYEKQGYYVQYQVVKTSGTFNVNGTWTKDATNTVKGLSVGDTVYARINDGNGNISYYKVVTITELETFETYEQYSAKNSTTATDIYYLYTDENGDTAYIPKDFSVGVSDSINKISTGLVVQDSNGNQFVWVPVDKDSVVYNGTTVKTDGTDTYKPMVQYQNGYSESTDEQYFESIRYDYSSSYSTGSKMSSVSSGKPAHRLGNSSNREPSLVTGAANYSWVFQASNNQYDSVSAYYKDICGFSSPTEMGQYMNEQYTNMVKSVKEYGGFYIGRFETSLTSGVIGSKINTTSMDSRKGTETGSNYGNLWYGMYNKQDSNRNTRNPYYGSTTVVSSMIWGSQYDSMLNWVAKGNDADMINKRTGNHSSSPAKTGDYGVDVMNNIFDLSANLLEWTQEAYSTNVRVYRGGYFSATSANAASTRNNGNPTYANNSSGSRTTLYLRSSEP